MVVNDLDSAAITLPTAVLVAQRLLLLGIGTQHRHAVGMGLSA